MGEIKYTTSDEINALKNDIANEKKKQNYNKQKNVEKVAKIIKKVELMHTTDYFDEVTVPTYEDANVASVETSDTAHRKKRSAFKIASNIFFAFIFIFLISILASVLIAKQSGHTPSVFGYQLYNVETGSMTPTLPVNSLILVRQANEPDKLKVGTIITFIRKGHTVTHRIVEIDKDSGSIKYKTKGDNPVNTVDTEPVAPSDIKGVYVRTVINP